MNKRNCLECIYLVPNGFLRHGKTEFEFPVSFSGFFLGNRIRSWKMEVSLISYFRFPFCYHMGKPNLMFHFFFRFPMTFENGLYSLTTGMSVAQNNRHT